MKKVVVLFLFAIIFQSRTQQIRWINIPPKKINDAHPLFYKNCFGNSSLIRVIEAAVVFTLVNAMIVSYFGLESKED